MVATEALLLRAEMLLVQAELEPEELVALVSELLALLLAVVEQEILMVLAALERMAEFNLPIHHETPPRIPSPALRLLRLDDRDAGRGVDVSGSVGDGHGSELPDVEVSEVLRRGFVGRCPRHRHESEHFAVTGMGGVTGRATSRRD